MTNAVQEVHVCLGLVNWHTWHHYQPSLWMQGIPVLQCMDLAHHNFTLVTHMQVPVHIVFWAAPVHWHNTNGALQGFLQFTQFMYSSHLMPAGRPVMQLLHHYWYCLVTGLSPLLNGELAVDRKHRQRRNVFLITLEATVQWMNLICYVVPNVFVAVDTCYTVTSMTYWFTFARWTCWNTVSLAVDVM